MLIPKTTFIRDEKHRRFIASLPCLISGSNEVQAAHIRKGSICGVALKPSDEMTIPLSVEQHMIQHKIGETAFWEQYGGIPRVRKLASDLYGVTGDRKAAMRLIMEWRCEIHSL